MKALYAHAAHDLRLEDCEPPALGAGQVRIRVLRGGICGSDLHYYNHGGFGAVRLREPMILGHEIAGEITALADFSDAFQTASDRSKAMKVQLDFGKC